MANLQTELRRNDMQITIFIHILQDILFHLTPCNRNSDLLACSYCCQWTHEEQLMSTNENFAILNNFQMGYCTCIAEFCQVIEQDCKSAFFRDVH